MARNNDRDRGKKRTPVRDLNRRGKPKVCIFCRDHITFVDYKDVNLLRRFISDRAKIKARRTTGTCVQHQRDVAVAIKTAREVALIPYTQRTVSDKAGGREGRGGRGGPGGNRPPSDRAAIPDIDVLPASALLIDGAPDGDVADDDIDADTPVYAAE
ncbi:MAG: small subunit ribosomal protein [Actinomycetota bacterium]|jgi:small subunit ribosomal protein S18|nr:small subunit ribosomal protein [Actinomycetota bacterium]